MPFKLAKKLKDSGFLMEPTLESLIQECQKKTGLGIKITISGRNSWWSMVTTSEDKNIIPVKTGSTPTEAVAKLWLALNQKK